MKRVDVSLYVILDRAIEEQSRLGKFTRDVIAGGATCLQIRCKGESTRDIMGFARRVLDVAKPAAVPVVINDRLDIALATGADGVHLGEEDMPVREARAICGTDMIVGASVRTVERAREAVASGADYVGVGPIFPSPAKPHLKPISLDILDAIRQEIRLPIVAIGGIDDMNAAVPMEHGADGVAVISALRQCLNPKEAAARLRQAVDNARKR